MEHDTVVDLVYLCEAHWRLSVPELFDAWKVASGALWIF